MGCTMDTDSSSGAMGTNIKDSMWRAKEKATGLWLWIQFNMWGTGKKE